MNALGNIRGKLILGLILGVVVIAGLSVFADFTKMLQVLRLFAWGLVPLILVATLFNYALRFLKWDVYLRLIGATGVPKRDSLLIFLSGMAMAITPGKVGEVLKSYLLKQVRGTPIAQSAPIVMAERLTDGIAMLILASVGLYLFDYGRPVMVAIGLFVLAFLFVFQNRALFNRLLTFGERVPVLASRIHHFHAFYESSYELFRLPNLLFGVGVGVVSWSGEVVAFVLVLMGMGVPLTPLLVIMCAFILSASTLIGSVTLLPGGLGTTDASIGGMLIFLVPAYLNVPMPQDKAVAATLLIRFATLWFGVAIGLVSLTIMQRRLGRISLPEAEAAQVREPATVGAKDAR